MSFLFPHSAIANRTCISIPQNLSYPEKPKLFYQRLSFRSRPSLALARERVSSSDFFGFFFDFLTEPRMSFVGFQSLRIRIRIRTRIRKMSRICCVNWPTPLATWSHPNQHLKTRRSRKSQREKSIAMMTARGDPNPNRLQNPNRPPKWKSRRWGSHPKSSSSPKSPPEIRSKGIALVFRLLLRTQNPKRERLRAGE